MDSGQRALGDWTTDAPGVRRLLTVPELPKPHASSSLDNGPHMVPRPADAWPKAPPGFVVELLVQNLHNPRKITAAPNGDLFVAEGGLGRVKILRPGPARRRHPCRHPFECYATIRADILAKSGSEAVYC